MNERFVEIRSPEGVRRVDIGEHPLTIGRLSDNVIIVSDSMASRHHCVIEPTAQGLRARDLRSSNGTILNGTRIDQDDLYNNDVITIGKVSIRLVDPDRQRPQKTRKGPSRTAAAPSDVGSDSPALDLDALAAIEGQNAPEPQAEEEFEELTEEDAVEEEVVDEIQSDEMSDVVPGFDLGDEEPITIEASDEPAPPIQTSVSEYEKQLEGLIQALPEPVLQETSIALVNARGQIVHPVGKARRSEGRREAVDIFRLILLLCLRNRGTDIHLEPKQDHYQVRIRVDGIMVEVVKLDTQMGIRMSALVKVLSDIDIAQKNAIQEGHFSAQAPTIVHGKLKPNLHRIDYRISFAPTVHAQKMVIRVMDTTNAPLKIDDLQLPEWMLETLSAGIQQEAGMVLVVGPTGSGKTTSLYSLIRSIEVTQLNVTTLEDPVEVELPGVTQIPVDEASGKSFSALLPSLLRQDPDVILVGEIRDSETARIAMQAAITGHLVFSTLHTKDSIGTIFRLLDLGVEPYLIAQGLHVVLSQRLVRQLCPFCKVAVKPTAAQQAKLMKTVGKVDRIYNPVGCPKCLTTGFSGRRAFFELLSATDALRDAILKTPSLEMINKALEGTQFQRLEHNGHLLVAQGVASFDEIDRAVTR